MKILKKVLNYDIEIVHDDQSSISFRVGHRLNRVRCRRVRSDVRNVLALFW